MNRLFIVLKDVMIHETTAYKEMLSLSKQKKEVLVKNNTKELDLIVASEQAILKIIKKLELKREELIQDIATEYHALQDALHLKNIIDVVKGNLHDELIQVKTELEKVLAELADYNMLNKTLIDTHLQYSAFCMEVLNDQLNSVNTYSHSGDMSNEKTSRYGLFDTKV